MAESEDNSSEHESEYENDDTEEEVHLQGGNTEIGACSSDDEVDDTTLLKSLKVLRRVCVSVVCLVLFYLYSLHMF